MEEWGEHAIERSQAVVSAKVAISVIMLFLDGLNLWKLLTHTV